MNTSGFLFRGLLLKQLVSGWASAGSLLVMASVVAQANAQPASTSRISVSSHEEQGNAYSNRIDISGDGRFVVFRSLASNLVPGDQNEASDVFVRDSQAELTTRVSVSSDGVEADLSSLNPTVSGDGRFVAFQSDATNLVENDTNGIGDVFVHDRLLRETKRVSVSSLGEEGNAISWRAVLSKDGRYIFFLSNASNLVEDDPNGAITDLFVHDQLTSETSRLPLGPEGEGPNDAIRGGYVSHDSRWVAFNTAASNLVSDDTNGLSDCFVYDRETGETSRVSVSSTGEPGNQPCQRAHISGDGRFVTFDTAASNLVHDDTNGLLDVFVHNLLTAETERVSVALGGTEPDGLSRNALLSADGYFISYFSEASNLVGGDTNQASDVFRYDRLNRETIRVSLSSEGVEGDLSSSYPHIADDGSRVIFQSGCTNLVPGDTNEVTDIFLREIPSNELYFAQFGEGMGLLSSQILLLNPTAHSEVTARISLRDSNGSPLDIDLNGEQITGEIQDTVEPSGVLSLKTDGLGELAVGSVTVSSDWPLAGVIVFGGTVGLAGVGQSDDALSSGFLAPVETRKVGKLFEIRTGIAVMNLDLEPVTLSIKLRNSQGLEIDITEKIVPRKGQLALYVDELDWPSDVDFSDFYGSVLVETNGRIAATVLQTRPDQFATLPVVPRN